MQRPGVSARFSLGRVCLVCGTEPPRARRIQLGTPVVHPSSIKRSSGIVFPARIWRRDSKMSSIVFTLRRSSRARAIAYRTNSDFEGNPWSLDASASNFACSFVSLRLMVSTVCGNTRVLLNSNDSAVVARSFGLESACRIPHRRRCNWTIGDERQPDRLCDRGVAPIEILALGFLHVTAPHGDSPSLVYSRTRINH